MYEITIFVPFKISMYLKADDVGRTIPNLLENSFFPVLPVEGPAWTVAVHLPGGVLVAQHVVAHHCEDA